MLPLTIDKVLEYESDFDATKGIEMQKQLGYVCVSHQVVAVTGRIRRDCLESRHALGFHKLTAAEAAPNVTTQYIPRPPASPTLRDMKFDFPAGNTVGTAA